MAVIRSAVKCPGTHDQVAGEGADNAHLHSKFVRAARLAFTDAVHFWSMPGVQLGLPVDGLTLSALSDDALGFVQDLGQGVTNGLAKRAGFAVHLAGEPPHNSALALDRPAHAFELTCVGITPGLTTQLWTNAG